MRYVPCGWYVERCNIKREVHTYNRPTLEVASMLLLQG